MLLSNCYFLNYYYALFFYTLLSLSGNLGHLTRVRLQQPQEQRYPVLLVHAGSFHVFVIHRTLSLTWTTGSLTGIRDHSYVCVYTMGLGTPTVSQHNILTWKNSQMQVLFSHCFDLIEFRCVTCMNRILHKILFVTWCIFKP